MKTPRDVEKRAATFYSRNHRAWLSGTFAPLTIGLQPPSGRTAELDDGKATKAWLQEWSRSAIPLQRQHRKLSYLGVYEVPVRVVLDQPETAAEVAGKAKHWKRINQLLDYFVEALGEPVRAKLVEKLSAWQGWSDFTAEQFIAVVKWLRTHDASEYYIRELPIYGVDTKWIEAHRGVVSAVVENMEFREKPDLVEMRSLDQRLLLHGLSHLRCRLSEIGDLPGQRVVLVENHVTFLALPPMSGTIAIYGAGLHAHSIVGRMPQLKEKQVMYWGDIDTHGFYILELVRRHLPNATSILMDVDTARLHEALAVAEPLPSRFQPELLTPGELQTLAYIRERSAVGSLRIEQERIVFDRVVDAFENQV
ncbi:hypothetical protein CKALI_00445 [Corynebacterium kalinowskii]|uniref:Wadjet protein JetD C-terminal domain-containing protein n=1 Tax=Corynebacterium kalinowskii TaxID=2675216 RepID=A0A6B8VUN7_9CORY|nr:Wadjet anti-phage system protein JetD domain-containing protein [Corynebacterium kalinowskii]QGU00990.1 hypothetical protein CKALI_00445 [Corynebacterium kalinowskii]